MRIQAFVLKQNSEQEHLMCVLMATNRTSKTHIASASAGAGDSATLQYRYAVQYSKPRSSEYITSGWETGVSVCQYSAFWICYDLLCESFSVLGMTEAVPYKVLFACQGPITCWTCLDEGELKFHLLITNGVFFMTSSHIWAHFSFHIMKDHLLWRLQYWENCFVPVLTTGST